MAGLLKVKDQVPTGATVVCVLTGNGLKDPDCSVSHSDNRVKSGIKPDIDEVAKAMGF